MKNVIIAIIFTISGITAQARMIEDQNGIKVFPKQATFLQEMKASSSITLNDSQSDVVCVISSDSDLPAGISNFQIRWSELVKPEYSIGLEPRPVASNFNTRVNIRCDSASGTVINAEMVARTLSNVLTIEWRVLTNQ